MLKTGKIALAAAVLLTSGTGALAQRGAFQQYEVYTYTFYADATKTEVVGYGTTRCNGYTDFSGEYAITSGSNSAYYDRDSPGLICTERGVEAY